MLKSVSVWKAATHTKDCKYRLHRPMCGNSILKFSIYKIGETLVFGKIINASCLRLMKTENSLVVQIDTV